MNNSNAMTQRSGKPKFSVAITTKGYQDLINHTLGDPNRAKRFIASITSAVAVNKELQECDAGTILAGALLGESLNLSPSPQLGQYYLVPFKSKAKYDRSGNLIEPETSKAQFILGYKGYIQLAIRSGYYKKLNVLSVKEGELVNFDALNEEIECKLIEDFEERERAKTVGYYAMFEYCNGFQKAIYWSYEKMLSHADKFSPAFSAKAYKDLCDGKIADRDMWKYSSFWYKDFDGMAQKTMLRQLISKWGVMSTELQTAFEHDDEITSMGESDNFITAEEIEREVSAQNSAAQPIVEQVNLDDLG